MTFGCVIDPTFRYLLLLPLNSSPNGKLLVDVVQKYSLRVANFHNSCEGKWTRIQPSKDGSMKNSVLDYVLLQQTLSDKLVNLLIDEEKIFCPYRVFFCARLRSRSDVLRLETKVYLTKKTMKKSIKFVNF